MDMESRSICLGCAADAMLYYFTVLWYCMVVLLEVFC